MKKFLLLCIALIASAGSLTFGQCGTVFYDGFESGNYSPTWTMGSGLSSGMATTNSPAVGAYCVEGIGGTTTHLTGFSTTITPATPTTISWWIKPTTAGAAQCYFVAGNSSISATNCIVFAYFQGSSNTIRFVSSVTQTYPATIGNWYFIELKNVNFTTHTFDIYVNGVLQTTNFPFRNSTQNDVSRIHLYNFNTATAYWDEIYLGTGTPFVISNVTTAPSCFGYADAAIDLNVTGGTPGYSYFWSTSDTTQDISGLYAGSYTVVVTDSAGCIDSTIITVNEPAALALTALIDSANCNGSNDGAIDLSTAGGTPGYAYLWSTADTTEDLSGIPAGTYTVTVTDTNACTATDTLTVSEPSAIMTIDSLTMPSCQGDTNGSVMITPSGGTPGYTYLWSTGDSTNAISGLSAGGYLFTVTDLNGCSYTDSLTIFDPLPVSILDSALHPMCNGDSSGSIFLTVSGGTPGYTYLWSTSDSSSSVSGLSAGSYTVTVTDANGCAGTNTFTLVNPPVLGSSGVVTDAVGASNGAVDLTVTGGTPTYTFAWSNGATTEDISSLAAGTYTVTITDANGCTSTDTFVVDFIEAMDPSADGLNQFSIYPNPFTDEIHLGFESESACSLEFAVYDLRGVQVRGTIALNVVTGYNEISMGSFDLPGGVYIYRLSGSGIQMQGRIVSAE